ncbi:Rieske 2Fe-2S domain-containing protein [Acetobacter conturbans]|uniref:Rieske 2Fe-2S domain-containing protein n=1 Tax=Acetobacter conturbans TaxID=1737472 RepID=A0ABX0JYL4_9PROT|nr:Rieske 2Fe-2S domain-containing protein [Acetobacter conturbans]
MAHYPFHKTGKPWPRNQWYVAAWSHEIETTPLQRKLLGHTIILRRLRNGHISAVSALCPHRRMPLASACIDENDQIVCPYHGATFSGAGHCTSLPFQKHVPDTMHLTAFATAETAPFIWIWEGNASEADMSLLPDIKPLKLSAESTLIFGFGYRHVRARAQIILENLFDESHISFTHTHSLGTRCASDRNPADLAITDQPDYLAFRHASPCRQTEDGMLSLFPSLGQFMQVEYRSELYGVSLINTVGTETFSCREDGTHVALSGCMNFLHGITPETETTTHYFIAATRDFATDSKEYTDILAERNFLVIDEDIRVLEAIEPHLEEAETQPEPNFTTDAAGIRVRRRIETLLEDA